MAPIPVPPKLALPVHKSSAGSNALTVSWYSAPYAVDYEIQISRNYTFTKIVDQTSVNGALEYTPAPLLLNTTYYWRVRSINIYGEKGKWSAYRIFKITQ